MAVKCGNVTPRFKFWWDADSNGDFYRLHCGELCLAAIQRRPKRPGWEFLRSSLEKIRCTLRKENKYLKWDCLEEAKAAVETAVSAVLRQLDFDLTGDCMNLMQCEEVTLDYDSERISRQLLVDGQVYDAVIDLTKNGLTFSHFYDKFGIRGEQRPSCYSRSIHNKSRKGGPVLSVDCFIRGLFSLDPVRGSLDSLEAAVTAMLFNDVPPGERMPWLRSSIVVVFDCAITEEGQKIIDYFSRHRMRRHEDGSETPYLVDFIQLPARWRKSEHIYEAVKGLYGDRIDGDVETYADSMWGEQWEAVADSLAAKLEAALQIS